MKASAALSAALALGTTGCAHGAQEVAPDTPGVPKCQDVWTVGNTLPQDYDGCLGDDGHLVMSGVSYCVDGTQFTTHESRFFARLGGTIGAGPDGSPGARASYHRFWSRCQTTPVQTNADDQATSSEQRSTASAPQENFETFAGDIFTVVLLDAKLTAAKVRFCATAPYQGSSIPVTRGPWSLQDQHGTLWSATEGELNRPGNAYPVEATVSVGDCLQGWVRFEAPAATTPVRVVYDSAIGGPFTWDLTTTPNGLADATSSQPLTVPNDTPAYTEPERDCYTLESAASPFSGNWLTLETRGQFAAEALKLQNRLNWLGYGCVPEDGDYGPVTQEAVMRFQRDFRLAVDGKVGPQTWETLFSID
jgi:hypothetical protein